MAVYSDERRPVLANLIKFSLLVNVVFFIILILVWILLSGVNAALVHTGIFATILIGLNFASFLIYEQLFRPDDDPLRRIAEILGSLQVLCSVLSLFLLLGTIAIALVPGLGVILPVAQSSQPAAMAPTPSSGVASLQTQVAAKPTECYQTSTGCMPIAPDPTEPPLGKSIVQNDPVVGSFIFDKLQFDPKTNYYSRAGNYDYNYKSVPLDHSPDIRWTFREDGVLLFYDNNKGTLLRTGTWSKADLGLGKYEYRIKRGNYNYRGSFQDGIFRITDPDFWNMTKVT
jgi:hypothetical protein